MNTLKDIVMNYKRTMAIAAAIFLTGAEKLGYIDSNTFANLMMLVSLLGGVGVVHGVYKDIQASAAQ